MGYADIYYVLQYNGLSNHVKHKKRRERTCHVSKFLFWFLEKKTHASKRTYVRTVINLVLPGTGRSNTLWLLPDFTCIFLSS